MIMYRFLYSCLRTATLPGFLLLAIAGPAQASRELLLVVGDSISAAYGMSLEEGWVSHLSRHLEDQRPQLTVVNASISGDTTDAALRRMPALLEEHSPDVVVLELGGNDGLRGFPIPTLRQNLERLVRLAQAAGARVVLLPMEIPPNYGARYTSSFRESYPQVAAATGSLLGDFILDGIATDPDLMQADGIHPGPEAQRAMMMNVLPVLEEALR